MKDAHICWLNKPSKPPTTMSAKRPIGLMPPCAKSLAGAVAKQILEHLRPMLDHMPQFAYCAERGVNDAILKVHSYFNEIESLQKGQIQNRFKMHQSVKQLACHGGACLSLDLSSAFDSVSRDLLIQSLLDHQIPHDLINIVQQLHHDAKYIFQTDNAQGQVTTSNGIKQGCRAAPTLWISFTLSILEHLAQHRSLSWVQKLLTLFADDFCGHWTITNLQDWKAVISDLTLLMETLATYNLKVGLQKTALLINLKGRSAKKVLRQHTRHKAGNTFLVLVVHGKECLLKIKESHTYLGTIISYRNRRDLNVGHRISAAQTRYQQLRKILNGRGPLSIKYRLRLWQACIPPSLTYSLEATGCTSKGLQRIKIVATRHLRAILREPAHLHHVKTSDIWERAKLPTPEQSILARMTKLRANRNPAHNPHGPDLITNAQVVEQLSSLIAMQPLEHQDLTPPEEAQPTPNTGFACAHCDLVLPTAHARLIHYAIKHPEATTTEAPRPQIIFHAPDHAINGLPTCKLCHRNFTKWQQLKLHIEKGSCIGLEGDSMKLSPPTEDNQAMRNPVQEPAVKIVTARAYEGPESQELAERNPQPIITDPSFLSKLDSWDQHLNCRRMRARLQSRCVVCGMWIADGKHIKQHYNRTHHHDFPSALEQAQQLCLTFKSQFTRGRSCRYCGSKVAAPCRHVIQCTVPHQLCLAVCLCKPGATCQDTSDGRPRDGDLRTLHALWGSGGRDGACQQKSQTGHQAGEWSQGTTTLQCSPREVAMEATAGLPDASSGLPDTPPQQDRPEARGAVGSTTEGHPVCPLLPAGRQVDPALPHECLSRVESQAGSGRSIHSILPANSLDQLPAARTSGQGSTSGGYRTRQGITEEGGMAHRLQRLDVHEVVTQASETCGRREQGATGSRRGCENHLRTPEVNARRDHPPVPEHDQLGKIERTRSAASNIPSRGISSWFRSHGSLRTVPEASGVIPDEPRGIQHEGGRPAAPAHGAASCPDDVRRRPEHSTKHAPIRSDSHATSSDGPATIQPYQ